MLYLTGGVRLERNGGLGDSSPLTTLPMLGASLVRGNEAFAVKLRGAYGKGIRPPRSTSRETTWVGMRPRMPAPALQLEPEEQSGIEGGIDLFVGRALTLGVTRFDQLASGLIQRVAVPVDTQGHTHREARRIPHALQNVGEIANRGWEMQGTTEVGPLSLVGAVSLVESRVQRLANGYTGDLRVGDRMLDVPARTANVTATWSAPRWSSSLTAYRAWDWVSYDRLALASDFANVARPRREMAGSRLRGYWREYDGSTRLGATTTIDVRRGIALVLAGDNLLNHQRGEPDNITILPGRTLTLGGRAEF
jgi:iron complex outermembrane receptor protein